MVDSTVRKDSQNDLHSDIETEVINRYAKGAKKVKAGRCCLVMKYNPKLLKVIPDEILKADYGCGDPSQYARPNDVVVDLGSGSGKICCILSQIVGREERVIGAVIYMGSFSKVHDDDGHTYFRGKRMAICGKTFSILTNPHGPYSAYFAPVLPENEVPIHAAPLLWAISS